LVFVAVYAPNIAAIVVSAGTEGVAGVRELLSRLFRWRVGIWWYVVVLVGIPALSLCARVLAAALIGGPIAIHFPSARGLLLAILGAVFLDPGPLGEELGWRGYALPRLMVGRSALSAAVILGLIWGAWHLPAFLLPGMPQSRIAIVPFMIGSVAVSILMTWVYNSTGGSVLLTILMHLMFNVSTGGVTDAFLRLISTVIVSAAAIIVVAVEGPQDLSRKPAAVAGV